MSDLVEDFLAREKDGLRGLENDIPAAATYYSKILMSSDVIFQNFSFHFILRFL